MENNFIEFIQQNSPDGGFLQSEEWRKFQEGAGRKTYNITSPQPLPTGQAGSPYKGEGDLGFWANIVEHKLPIAGKYFYVPRGPVVSEQEAGNRKQDIEKIIDLAKRNKAGWIRIEPSNSRILDIIRDNWRVVKAPHDVQPKELFIIDITKSEEELLAEMKPKARYNIRLAEKKGVTVKITNYQLPITNEFSNSNYQISNKKYINEFLRLTEIMAKRQGIMAHPENYYRKMIETIPGDVLKLYVAEYDGKTIVANLVMFFGETCTYLHGASDDEYRNVMAPYLLQWQQIKDAKKAGCSKYDFGGIKTQPHPALSLSRRGIKGEVNSWAGITKFKLGFSPGTKPTEFPGCYDIIINPMKYHIYRLIQKIKNIIT